MRRLLTVLIMLSATASTAFPETGGTVPSILRRSPFLPPGFQPPGGSQVSSEIPVSSGQFEFHGVFQIGGVYHFNLYNKRDNKGTWVIRNETVEGLPRIIRYEPEEDLLTVEVAGEPVALQLIQTSDQPVPLAAGAAPQQVTTSAGTTAAPRQTPPRRRVIRPTSRTTSTSSVRRPVIRPSTQNQ